MVKRLPHTLMYGADIILLNGKIIKQKPVQKPIWPVKINVSILVKANYYLMTELYEKAKQTDSHLLVIVEDLNYGF